MKLIKPVKAVEVIADYFDKICDTEHEFDESELLRLMERNAEVDAVPVVRCKNCKYWLPHSQFGFDEDNDEFYDYCELLVPDDDYYAITRQADDFCSRAERKKNEGVHCKVVTR